MFLNWSYREKIRKYIYKSKRNDMKNLPKTCMLTFLIDIIIVMMYSNLLYYV